MGYMSVLSFYAKVSMGNAEQAITRQWMRLGLHLELSQLLGIFYSHIGPSKCQKPQDSTVEAST